MFKQTLIKMFAFCLVSCYCEDYSDERDDYKSLESGELPEINKEIYTKDYLHKNDLQLDSNNTEKYITVINPIKKVKSTLRDQKPPVIANTTAPYRCGKLRGSNSKEEDRCMKTLVTFPYSVSIQNKGAHFASGALIDNQTVLTAAGDFFNVRESIKIYSVRLGSVDCKQGGVLLPIKSVNIHPSYVMGKPAYDLAVLKLAFPVNVTSYVKPISLSTEKQKVISAKFTTTYWPRIIVHGEVLPKTAKERVKYHSMRVSTQKLIPWKNCLSLMKTRGVKLDENSLCLKPITTHHTVCTPDVGAPVVSDDGLWGITSGWISEHCKQHPSPTIFTRITLKPVQSWLAEVM